jgi:hypothetical protein
MTHSFGRYMRMQIPVDDLPPKDLIANSSLVHPSVHGQAYPSSRIHIDSMLCIPPNAETIAYTTVGACIYCGSSEYYPAAHRDLGEEHIITGALGASLVLSLASCKKCESDTTAIESKVIQSQFESTKRRFDIKGRRNKSILKSNFTISHRVNGKDIHLRLPIEEHPLVLFQARFGSPGILCGRPRELHGVIGTWSINLNADKERLKQQGIKILNTSGFDTFVYAQFLAKIGHAFAAAEARIENFCPL